MSEISLTSADDATAQLLSSMSQPLAPTPTTLVMNDTPRAAAGGVFSPSSAFSPTSAFISASDSHHHHHHHHYHSDAGLAEGGGAGFETPQRMRKSVVRFDFEGIGDLEGI